MEILCGKRAMAYLSGIYEQNRAVAQRLSVKQHDTAAAVERLEGDLNAAKLQINSLEDKLFSTIAAENTGKGDMVLFQPAMKPDSVRKLADAVAKTCGGLAAVFAGEDGQYNYALVRADGGEIAPLVKALNAALNGRGGGRSGFAQGSVQAEQEAVEAFFKG